jgi:NAD(P)-dependent dehydrogenase (short-subunit alcohol dehydrogenase family)
MDLQLNGKTALVTGATAGIGLEIARTLATEGARVVITGRDRTKLDSAVDAIMASGGSEISGILADATSADGAANIAQAEPSIDILVNNLGIYESKAFGDITDAEWSTCSMSTS